MSAAEIAAAAIYGGLAALVLLGLASALSKTVVRALAWIEARNERWDAEDAAVFGPREIWGPTDAEADAAWAEILDAVQLTPAQVHERYEAARLADRMDKIRADIACNRFRRELDDFDGGAA